MSDTEGDTPMTEQRKAYADLADGIVRIGLLLVVATFVPYVLDILSPRVELSRASELWSLPLQEYLAKTGGRPGLWWVSMLRYADYLPLAAIAFLASASIICYLRVIPIFARNRMAAYVVIAALQVVVFLIAASGVLAAGPR